jgi:hypothetical protein
MPGPVPGASAMSRAIRFQTLRTGADGRPHGRHQKKDTDQFCRRIFPTWTLGPGDSAFRPLPLLQQLIDYSLLLRCRPDKLERLAALAGREV